MTTTYVRRSGRITDGMRTGWRTCYETPNFDSEVDAHPPGMALPRTALVRLKRLRIGVGRFRSCLHKWGMVPSTLVSVTRAEQAVANVCMLAKVCFAIFLHVVLHCLIH